MGEIEGERGMERGELLEQSVSSRPGILECIQDKKQ